MPRLRLSEETGFIFIDDAVIHLELLQKIADPDKRLLWRFERRGNLIVARAYTEKQVIWSDDGDAAAEIVIGVKG